MGTYYKTFFQVTIDHNYYDDGVCRDFDIRPLPETARLFAGHKLMFKKEINGFKILFQALDNNRIPTVELDEGVRLNFSMHLKNSSLYNFTELPDKSSHKEVYHFDSLLVTKIDENDTVNYKMELSADSKLETRPNRFSYYFESESDKVNLQVRDVASNLIIDRQFESEDKTFNELIELQGFPTGKYVFSRSIDGEIEGEDEYYIVDLKKTGKPFGFMTISKDALITYQQATQFHIKFQTRSVPWKYNFLLTKDYIGEDFSIVENEVNNGSGSRYNEVIEFVETSARSAYTKGETIVFESGQMVGSNFQPQKIPYYQSPKKSLQLKTNSGQKIVISHLPNPAINSLKPEVYINV